MTTTNEGTQRDELAEVIRGIDGPATLGGLEVADAILAAGYRKPRTITTVEELDALPDGSQIQDADPALCQKANGRWYTPGDGYDFGDFDITLPATVLHEPEAEVEA